MRFGRFFLVLILVFLKLQLRYQSVSDLLTLIYLPELSWGSLSAASQEYLNEVSKCFRLVDFI